MIDVTKFAERLEELMFYAGVNALQLSAATDIDQSNIYKYLSGAWLPSCEVAVKLCDYFKCTLDFAFARDDKNDAFEFAQCPPFPQRLREIIKENNLTNAQFIKRTGVSEAVFYRWLNGKRSPTAESIARIADGLERTMDYVAGREK